MVFSALGRTKQVESVALTMALDNPWRNETMRDNGEMEQERRAGKKEEEDNTNGSSPGDGTGVGPEAPAELVAASGLRHTLASASTEGSQVSSLELA